MFPHLSALVIDRIERRDGVIELAAWVRAGSASCRRCGQVSATVHGRYVRQVTDVSVAGTSTVIQLAVRRFRCVNEACSATTFAEQVPGLTMPHSRHTPGLRAMLTAIGLALAGRAGSRLAAALGQVAGRDTLLRLVKAIPEEPLGVVKVLGVDDFALRRGHHYGTLLIDLDTHRPLDMFDGRDGDRLASWLREHPGVEVICRDRASGYAEGARSGAPQAIQIADRFHLWQNLGQVVEKTVNALRPHLAEPTPAAPSTEAPLVVQRSSEKKIVRRMREHYAAVQHLIGKGWSKAAVGRQLDLHPATVRKFANAASIDELIAKTEQRAHVVDAHIEYLHQRWNDGHRNATQLFREITEHGYTGGELAVQRYLRHFRHGRGHAPVPAPKPPSVRQITSWIMTRPDRLTRDDTAQLRKLRRRSPDLNRLVTHVRDFATMLTELQGQRLDTWITTAENDTLRPLASFANFLRRDLDAVRNGLTLPHSSGPVEGTINRLKMLKRQMFGRAGLDLLRKRLIHT
ncbi:ISL3 family transposase [Actinokineospora sp. 24-640]